MKLTTALRQVEQLEERLLEHQAYLVFQGGTDRSDRPDRPDSSTYIDIYKEEQTLAGRIELYRAAIDVAQEPIYLALARRERLKRRLAFFARLSTQQRTYTATLTELDMERAWEATVSELAEIEQVIETFQEETDVPLPLLPLPPLRNGEEEREREVASRCILGGLCIE